MHNEAFKQRIAKYLRARFSFLSVSTWEEERVISEIKQLCADEETINTTRNVFTWSVTEGYRSLDRDFPNEQTPIKALDFIEKIDEPAVFILKDFHTYLGGEHRQADFNVIRKIRDLAAVLEKSTVPKNVIFVSPIFNIPLELQKDIVIVDYDLPSYDEIKASLDEIIAANQNNERITINLTDDEEEKLVKAALGLTLQEAENAFALSMVSDGKLNMDSISHVLKEKQQIIQKTGILEYIPVNLNMEDVGGLDNIKRWLTKRNNSWLGTADDYGLPSPKGVLITGVPGCGKSLIAKAMSAMWHLPLLKLDMGKIFSGVVGSSEQNMRKAIQTAEAIAPGILWIDEIEKGLSGTGSGGDGGTSTRIFGSLLTWMQEKTKPVFVIATANNIQSLPPELLRKGRFDEIFFVDLPTKKERQVIFNIHLNKRLKSKQAKGDFEISADVLDALAEKTEGFVGAEIEQAVISGLFEAFYQNRSITLQDLEQSIEQTVPLSVTQAEQIRSLREWANVRAVAATSQEDRNEYGQDTPAMKAAPKEVKPAPEDIKRSRGGRSIDF
ncbi:AAA family ATPase [Salipaludibacillus sp. LMS25]|jgi:SpoVK/Ycf46/Vps4 family AAA+-type ATPase|uniref:AAA family ATPase n=1 Tax=Salipaludibacillus sp. LMS25 TaxID=2924031 RepID=UPI0020D08BE5|nr:AAA family ATPase [Salipaludibacillus sp. LMS25]UTR13187.1 AAA family ATPase [Salipaludibacillus sp. LMS25]